MKRKEFIKTSSAGLAGLSLSPLLFAGASQQKTVSPDTPHYKKRYMLGPFPDRSSYSVDDRFAMLKLAGFSGVEPASGLNRDELIAARDADGLDSPSLVCSTHWPCPVSSPYASVRQPCRNG